MIESFVASFVDGRVRLRHPALKKAEQAEQARELLAVLPGMLRVSANSRTGSLLIEYDPAQISCEDLLGLAGQWEAWAAETPGAGEENESGTTSGGLAGACGAARRRCGISRAQAIRFTNRGMLATLAASLVLGVAGRERGHVVAGGLFLLLNLAHLYTYRKCL